MAVDWLGIMKTVAPTVASALLGPLSGAAVAAIGGIIGVPDATQETIKQVITNGQLTQEHLGKLRELELQYQSEERERGFRYAELEFKDRDSARQMAIQTGAKTPAILTWIVVSLVLGFEGALLFGHVPVGVSDIVLGRVLGTLDTSLAIVLAFWFGSTHGSTQKTALLAQAQPVK